MIPSISVIIPTHKRAAILRETLRHLEAQTIADQLEVIVVSDGHDSETSRMFQRIENGPAFAKASVGRELKIENIRSIFLEIKKTQQGVARNRGLEKATAPITLFIGDDAFLAPDACEKHLEIHHSQLSIINYQFPVAVLGFTTWDPAVGITPVMKWLEKTGWQFGYSMIKQYAGKAIPQDIQHRFTYTIHISLPTRIAREHPFREDLTLYGWEDVLWGKQLADANVALVYEPRAKALHHHRITLEDSLKRMETIGRSAAVIRTIDPSFDRLPQGWKAIAYRLLSTLPTMRGKHAKALLRGVGR